MNYRIFALAEELGGAFSPERWAYVGKMMLLGMTMIFAVLGLLWAVLTVFKLVMVGKTEKPKTPKSIPSKPVASPVASTPPAVPSGTLSEEELVAVLTAAVMAYRAEEGTSDAELGAFRVVSFRRATGGRAWNAK